MANIIDIDLYSSPEDIGSPLRATSLRKPYTSLLYVLFFLTVGMVIYFYFSSHEYQGAIAEAPPPKPLPKKPPLSVIVRKNLVRWSSFIKGVVVFKPEILVSNGEEEFLCYFSSSSIDEAWRIKDSLKSISKAPQIIDTATVNGEFKYVIRGKLKNAPHRNPAQPVQKFMRTTVMNFIDSLAAAKGLAKPERIQIGISNVEGGECFRYMMSSSGSLIRIGRFFSDVIKIDYSISPQALAVEKTDSLYSLKAIWGLYDFQKPADTTKVVSK
ncbi:hypothetical protein J7M00_01065 [bacterium]|nr:hypothetical protein [bacterium]